MKKRNILIGAVITAAVVTVLNKQIEKALCRLLFTGKKGCSL